MKIAMIGVGNMGEAILDGIVNSKAVAAKDIYVVDRSEEKLNEIVANYSCSRSTVLDAVESSDIVILAIKPKDVEDFFHSLKRKISKDQLFISIISALSINEILNYIGIDKQVVRVMPNIAAKVQASVSCIAHSKKVTPENLTIVEKIFSSIGSVYSIDENKMDIVTGLTGSAPAFIFQIIEAMSEAAVLYGLDRKLAIAMAADTVMGAGKMVSATKLHPAVLKDMVTSPAGTTIEGILAMEKNAVRSSIIQAVSASIEKSRAMDGKKKVKK